jgi:hypothetical protein
MLALLVQLGKAGCASGVDRQVADTGSQDKGDNGRVSTDCLRAVEQAVLKKAVKVNQTARIVERRDVYGDRYSYGDVILVRVSDDTEPSDYVAVTARPRGVLSGRACHPTFVEVLDSGLLSAGSLAGLRPELPSASCQAVVAKQVLAKARLVNDTAEVVGMIPLYGSQRSYGNALIVRVSDETEPSHYAVVTSRLDPDHGAVDPNLCRIARLEMIASGRLPELSEASTPQAQCMDPAEHAVMQEAAALNDTATVTERRMAYGGQSLAEIFLMRVSDETEPSDYAAIASRRQDDAASDGTQMSCSVSHVHLLGSGLLPQDLGSTARTLPRAKCVADIEARVRELATEDSNQVRVVGMVSLYGERRGFADALVVRVADGAARQSDYGVVISRLADGVVDSRACDIVFAGPIGQGTLPAVPGL